MRSGDLLRRAFAGRRSIDTEQRRRWASRIVGSVKAYPRAWGLASDLGQPGGGITLAVGTRRSAKSETPCRALTALAVLRDGFVAHCMARTFGRLTRDSWERDGDRGALGWLDTLGIPHQTHRPGGQLHAITFPWGSTIRLHPVDNARQIEHLRGIRGDAFWIEEAQGVTLLGPLLTDVLAPATIDRNAVVLMGGTPGEEIDSVFYGAIQDPGSRRHLLATWHNPYLPGDTPESRWQHVVSAAMKRFGQVYGVTEAQVDALRELDIATLDAILTGEVPAAAKHLLATDSELYLPPAIQRELLGRWVATPDIYVHPVMRWGATPYWCAGENPHRASVPEGVPEIRSWRARVAALPQIVNGRAATWELLIGLDMGNVDACGLWVGALCRDEGVIYELQSGARTGLSDDQQFAWLRATAEETVRGFADAGRRLGPVTIVVDADGGRRSAWSHRLQLQAGLGDFSLRGPIKQGTGASKRVQIREINLLLAEGRLRCVAGDECDLEQRNLQWRPRETDRQVEPEVYKYRPVTLPDGTRCADGAARPPLGDHALDARRYAVITGYVLAGRDAPAQVDRSESVLRDLLRAGRR